jgi:energy-coupling factor transport system ATP-binding protein
MVKNITYKYHPDGRAVLKSISFSVKKGEILAVVGLSGCGKSTLCLCLGGIIPNYLGGELTGSVLVNGRDTKDYKVAQLALEVGLVFQEPDTQLFSTTVEDEIAFGPENLCLPVEEVRNRVNSVLDMLGIGELRQTNPNHLSGGQKHLVAMGAVLAMDPAILVLDEVMAQMDLLSKNTIKDILNDLRRRGKTIVIIEHDLESVAMADRLLVLEDGLLLWDGQVLSAVKDREFLLRHKLLYEV